MTSNHHALYDLGHTRTTMAINKEMRSREVERTSQKLSQFGSQAATRLREAGIASNRGSACRGEYVPGPCTHRPSHHESRGGPEVGSPNRKEDAAEGKTGDWGEVVTR